MLISKFNFLASFSAVLNCEKVRGKTNIYHQNMKKSILILVEMVFLRDNRRPFVAYSHDSAITMKIQ